MSSNTTLMENRSVLVVDDDADTLDVVSSWLRHAGYTVCSAPDAGEALAAMDRSRPGLVVLDLMMPEVNGYELLPRLREHSREADLQVLAFSGFLPEPDDARLQEARFAATLSKPADPDTLLQEVRRLLPLEEARDEMPGRGRLVLVVDDNPLTQALLEIRLRQSGFAVWKADEGEQALEIVRERRPAAIVTDLTMPILDGFALCKAIREDPALADLPVIITSSQELTSAQLTTLYAVGANGYAIRSPGIEEILELLLAHLDGTGDGVRPHG